MRLLLALILPLATMSFILGLMLPLMVFERLYFLEDTPSLIEIVTGLWEDGERSLAGIVALFSVIFPAAKILALHIAAINGRSGRSLGLMTTLGKWSMMDVMLVALAVFAAKTSGLAAASVLPGLWFYAGATLLTAISAHLVRRSA
ncbi:paraquat-inducible protein A [Stappia sp. F7233]|uniref:Paraquat-inducible protein A n=1 Tax=Stappia albiluteola TaxID=2758565 RepID=A0A839ABY9_9HYPH|nr:paraquat-inducible protein A [Stappia albiluteola]MBA5777230.1 paraquat-inducible protein A [Stappia albiluteola]